MLIKDLEMRHELDRGEMAAVRGGHELPHPLPTLPGVPSIPSPEQPGLPSMPDLSEVERSLAALRKAVEDLFPGQHSNLEKMPVVS